MDFLTKEWFSLPVWAWLLIAVVIVALIIILVVVSIRSKNSAENEEEYADYDENSYIAKKDDDLAATRVDEADNAVITEEKAEVKAEAKAETKPAEKKEVKIEAKAETKPTEKKEVKVEAKAETKTTEKAEAETPEKPQRPTTKTYHISKRKDDGKWQVKMSKGAKAIKLFATQAEAIEYAKKLADNQDATIMIHKVDGSFRRLNYSSKKN